MPPGQEADPNDPGGTPDPTPEGAPVLVLSPDQVRSTPEYRAISRQLRDEARARGRAEGEAAAARTAAEEARQAAEAQRQQALAEQLSAVLGEDGVAAFNEIAALSETDPVGAARKFQELAARSAQSGTPAAPTAPGVSAGGTTVQQPTPPPPGTGLSGDAPLGQPTTGVDWDGIATEADTTYADVVKRNQDPVTRNRVTDRERGKGFMAWLTGSYVRGMKQTGRLPRG